MEVAIGSLYVAATTDSPYPDAAQDLANRCKELLSQAVMEARIADWDPTLPQAPLEEELEEDDALIDVDEDDF